MTLCIILLACGAIALALFLRERLRGHTLRAALAKSVVSAIFVGLGCCAWFHSIWAFMDTHLDFPFLGAFVVPGLVFGLMGDIWLDLKFVYPSDDAPLTYAGFAAFGVGHILYQLGLILQYYVRGVLRSGLTVQFVGPGKPGFVLVPMGLAVVLTFGNVLMEKPMKLRYGQLKPVVIAYGFLLFFTVLLSGSLALMHGWSETSLNVFFVGSILFALSDLILSGTYFGEGKDRPADVVLNHVSYYAAQFLIAFSLAFV